MAYVNFESRLLVLSLALLAAVAGCATPFGSSTGEKPVASKPCEAKDLRPGMYCQLDMVLPPTAMSGSYQCYTGKVVAVTQEEIVLGDTAEDTKIDYETAPRRATPIARQRGTIRVPLAGIGSIQVAQSPAPKSAPAQDAKKTPGC